MQATDTCQRVFGWDRDLHTCAGARDGTCLSAARKAAIGPIFAGAPFYAPFPFDSGIAGGGVPFWAFTAPLALDSGVVGTIFKVPPSSLPLSNGPAFSLQLDIRATLAEPYATDATYREAAMSFMTPPDAGKTNAVRQRGAKILAYHSVSDPIFSVADTETRYRGIDRASGQRAREFARLYRIPGMGHCSGGPAADQADFLSPLVAWVEQGVAQASITASARGPGNPGGINADVPAGWAADRTRPPCPYPSVARYVDGDVERATSWSCEGRGGKGH